MSLGWIIAVTITETSPLPSPGVEQHQQPASPRLAECRSQLRSILWLEELAVWRHGRPGLTVSQHRILLTPHIRSPSCYNTTMVPCYHCHYHLSRGRAWPVNTNYPPLPTAHLALIDRLILSLMENNKDHFCPKSFRSILSSTCTLLTRGGWGSVGGIEMFRVWRLH